MADIKLSIFDMDGTLLDSMPYWENVGRSYLESKGIDVPDDLEETIVAMTLTESAIYMKERFGIEESAEQVIRDSLWNISLAYQFEIPAKPGMKKLVKEEKEAGHEVVVLTSSEKNCAVAALKRTGLYHFFDHVYTADEIGIGKDDPEAFCFVCREHGVNTQETHCFEDAFYAVKAAKEAGCYVTAVYDTSMTDCWDAIAELSDEQIRP